MVLEPRLAKLMEAVGGEGGGGGKGRGREGGCFSTVLERRTPDCHQTLRGRPSIPPRPGRRRLPQLALRPGAVALHTMGVASL